MTDSVLLHRPGLLEYDDALRWQDATASALRDETGGEALAILQHPPVYTLGRRARSEHLLVDSAELAARGAEVVRAGRGGDVTFHGPGQLVAYPILDLRRRGLGAANYVRALEATVIETLARFGVRGERVSGRPGVWVGDAKLAAIGVRVRRGVSTHGLALNVSTDLSWFEAIVPCGIPGAEVISLARLPGALPAHERVEQAFAEAFEQVFDVGLEPGEQVAGEAPALAARAPAAIDGR